MIGSPQFPTPCPHCGNYPLGLKSTDPYSDRFRVLPCGTKFRVEQDGRNVIWAEDWIAVFNAAVSGVEFLTPLGDRMRLALFWETPGTLLRSIGEYGL